MKKDDKLKNGVELMLSLALSLDLLEQYNASHLLKKKINMAKDAIEEDIKDHYIKSYNKNEEFIQNSLNFKESIIKKISKYNEVDCILAAAFLQKFDDNIELARKKNIVFFDKII